MPEQIESVLISDDKGAKTNSWFLLALAHVNCKGLPQPLVNVSLIMEKK